MMCAQNPLLPLERMQMEQSSDDTRVAAARNLHYLAYISTALATFWTYDYACSLHEEWIFLLRSRWTKIKTLYIIARYFPFCFITANLYLTFAPNENPDKCRMLINTYSCFGVISIICSECFFVLRIYALWNNNRIVLMGMLSTLFVIIVSFIGVWFSAIATSHVTISTIPGITGCYRDSPSIDFSIPFLLLFVFALGLVSLTLIHVLRSWQTAKGSLHAVLVKHSILYHACNLFLSAVNIIMPVLSSYSAYYIVFEHLQVFILVILATRMHLHLWNTDQHMHGSDTFAYMSNISPADRAV
ncbi:hypothetical protein EDB19DRAFT_922059 [Suillus lakei]|nr:hypothetical protein EDB19DRAFT_922059 [Suillus lakei]